MPGNTKILISGVTRLEQFDLEDALAENVEFRSETLGPDEHGEFLTAAAVVTLAGLAIRAVAVWLAKNRSRGDVVDEELTVELPDGTRITRRIRARSTSSSELPDGVVTALEEVARMPIDG